MGTLPLCQIDFKPPVQHHFKPGLAATGAICAHAQIQRITIPEEEQQLEWPAGAIPAKLLISPERICPSASLTLLLPAKGWGAPATAELPHP